MLKYSPNNTVIGRLVNILAEQNYAIFTRS
jgi:hypothetical protein